MENEVMNFFFDPSRNSSTVLHGLNALQSKIDSLILILEKEVANEQDIAQEKENASSEENSSYLDAYGIGKILKNSFLGRRT